jgi:hypothetical protein
LDETVEIRGFVTDSICDSRWGASSNIVSTKTTYENIRDLGAREDILGYDPEGHPEWANLLLRRNNTCFQTLDDEREEVLQAAS